MSEPTTTFRDEQGEPLRRWAVRAGMVIESSTYNATTGDLELVVRDAEPADA